MNELFGIVIVSFALIGFFNTGLWLGKISYRWTCALDELIKQRKERKKK